MARGACSTRVGGRNGVQSLLLQTLNRVYHSENVNVDWRVLKIILNKQCVSI
jgi:hypothetical protein